MTLRSRLLLPSSASGRSDEPSDRIRDIAWPIDMLAIELRRIRPEPPNARSLVRISDDDL